MGGAIATNLWARLPVVSDGLPDSATTSSDSSPHLSLRCRSTVAAIDGACPAGYALRHPSPPQAGSLHPTDKEPGRWHE
jgi:hypothetical protein